MLQFIRSKAGSWIIKILLTLIIVSFAAWGISDIFRKDENAVTVASIDGYKVTSGQIRRDVFHQINMFSRMFGREFDLERVKEMGLHRHVVQNLISEAVINRFADQYKLRVGETQIRDAILKKPEFQGPDGQFDPSRFQMLISQGGLSESEIIRNVRKSIAYDAISDTLGSIAIPNILIDDLFDYKNEKRVSNYIKIAHKNLTPPEPKEEELVNYHKEKSDKFMAPEYRSFKLLKINPKEEAEKIQVPEDDLKKEYNDRITEFTRPEKREVHEFLTKDIETAREVRTQLQNKKPAPKIVEGLTKDKVTYREWGLVTADDIPDDIKDSVLMLALDEISDPLETKEGFHVVQIRKIEKAGVDSFETVKDHIAKKIKLAKATDQAIDVSNKIDEKISEGETLETISETFKIPLVDISQVDQKGIYKNQDQKKDDAKNPDTEIVQTAFATPLKETTGVQENQNGDYYFLRVEEIISSAVRPFEEVKDQVKKFWLQEKQRDLAQKQGEEILEETKKGQSLASIAKAKNLDVVTSPEFTRDGKGLKGALPQNIVHSLFRDKVGDAEGGLSGDSYVVAQLDRIIPVTQREDESRTKIQKNLEKEMKQDIMGQFEAALKKKYNAKIDETVLESIF